MLGLVALAPGRPAAAPDLSPASNRELADTQASQLLTKVPLPDTAVASANEPAGDDGVLAQPSESEATPNLVDRSAYWTVPGSSTSVLDYVKAHLPPGATPLSSGRGNVAPGYGLETFALPSIPGRLGARVFGLTVVQLDPTTTGVRTDGETVWIVNRPAWERIPAGVRSVTVTARGQTLAGRLGPASRPAVLRGRAAARVAALVNRLPRVQPGASSCPAAFLGSVRMRFRDGSGRLQATAVEHPSGCATVGLTVAGRRGPLLTDTPSVMLALQRLHAFAVCRPAALAILAGIAGRGAGAAADDQAIAFQVLNRSDRACRLTGVPHLSLVGASGRRVPTRERHAADAPGPVVLDPRQRASFDAAFATCGAPAVSVARITLAGVGRVFDVAAGSPGHPFAPCAGRLTVSGLVGVP
jgi:hypothetical protein